MALGIIQARMGSTRLPGKMMLPLDGSHVIERIIERTAAADHIDDVVVATSDTTADDIIARYAKRASADVHRGSETDVLGRLYEAAATTDAERIVRMCGDRPLIPKAVIDGVVTALQRRGGDYASNLLERTFPWGWGCEAFTFKSFETVEQEAQDPHDREHVTPYYRNNPETFDLHNVTSEDVFDDGMLHSRTDLRLTLDEADDYELIKKVYEELPHNGIHKPRDVIKYIDKTGLQTLNAHLLD
jgi:spore coat polysaccharide biosynthesis protein SpsF